jgi:hypothetical protein
MYLILGALAAFAEFYVRAGFFVSQDIVQMANNLLENEHLFRLGIVIDLLGGACNAILAVAFYTALKPINEPIALLASFWRLGETVLLGHMGLNSLIALDMLHSSGRFAALSHDQWIAMANIFLRAQGDEFSIGLVFFALGSTLFCYLLTKSAYLPRLVAWWGTVGSVIALIGTLLIILRPDLSNIAPTCYLPVGLYEIAAGLWLVTRLKRNELLK